MSTPNRSLPSAVGELPSRTDDAQDVTFLALVNMLLRNRWLLLTVPTVLFALVVAFSFSRERTYTSRASFVPQEAQGTGGLRGLEGVAARLGVSVPTQRLSESPAFYAYLLTSHSLLEAAVKSRYRIAAGDASPKRDLIEIFETSRGTPAASQDEATRVLRRKMTVDRDRETGVISVEIRTFWPQLSHEIADRVIALVNEFNLERRRSNAAKEREFVQQRLHEAGRELRETEGHLESFLRQNRSFRNSPELQFQHDRLQQAVLMRQEVYTSLAQAYEQARIEEVRNLPVITVVEAAILPVRPDARGTVGKGAVALVVGFALAFLLALARELARRSAHSEENDLREFEALRQQAVADLKHPLRGLGRAVARRN